MNEAMQAIAMAAVGVSGWFIVMVGVGCLLWRLFGLTITHLDDIVHAFWVGWGVVIILLQIWHLTQPVNMTALLMVGALSLIGLTLLFGAAKANIRSHINVSARVATIGLLLLIFLVYHTTAQPILADTGLYHAPAVKWTRTCKLVVGLGNLMPWLAYNESYHLFSALIDVSYLPGKYHHVANGVLFYAVLLKGALGIRSIWGARQSLAIPAVFDAVMLVPTLWHIVSAYGYASSPSPDAAVYCLGIFVTSEILRLMEATWHRNENPRNTAWQYRAFSVALLCVVGVAVKITFVYQAIGSALFAALLCIMFREFRQAVTMRLTVLASAAVLAVGLPWVARGVATSGYFFYPNTTLPASVDWRIPTNVAEANRDAILAWSRRFGSVQFADIIKGDSLSYQKVLDSPWRWLWMNRLIRKPFESVVPFALTVGAAIVAVRRRKTAPLPFMGRLWLVTVIPTLSLLFWSVITPDLRYAGGLFWSLSAASIALSAATLAPSSARMLLAALCGLLLVNNINPLDAIHVYKRDVGPIKTVPMKVQSTASGLKVLVPTTGEEVWNAPVPAAGILNPNLRLRVPGRLDGGFRIDRNPATCCQPQ